MKHIENIAIYLLFTILFVAQFNSTFCAFEEELEFINQLRKELGNKQQIAEHTVYEDTTSWQELWVHGPKDTNDDNKDVLKNGIQDLHSLLVQDREVPEFEDEIVITTIGSNVRARYLIGPTIATGSQGSISLGCTTTRQKKTVAIKKIKLKDPSDVTHIEAEVYERISGLDGVPLMLNSGTYFVRNDKYLVIILKPKDIDLLKLSNVFGEKFSLATSLILFRNLIKITEVVHTQGIVHQDIKAANIMINFATTNSKMQMTLVDFGVAEGFEWDLSKRSSEPARKCKSVGSFDTMSIFAHEGHSPHPRNDLESCFHWFYQAIEGKFPYQASLKRLNTEELSDDVVDELLREIMASKLLAGQTLGVQYPELKEFFDYVRGIKYEENPDYVRMDKILLRLMNQLGIVDDGKFDWDIRPQLLFRNPNVLHVCITHLEEINMFRLRFDAFYTPLLLQLKDRNLEVTVLDNLHVEAFSALFEENTKPGIFTAEDLPYSDLYKLNLDAFTDYRGIKVGAITNHGQLFAGFGVFHNKERNEISFSMILKSEIEIWNALEQIELPVPHLQPIWNSKKMRDIAAQNYSSSGIAPRFLTNDVQLGTENRNPLVVVSEAYAFANENFVAMIQGKEIFDMGMKCTVHEKSNKVEVVFAYRRQFNITEDMPCGLFNYLQNFTWSTDESKFEEVIEMQPLKRSSKNNKGAVAKQTGFQEVKDVENCTAPTWPLARNKALAEFFKTASLNQEMMNIRMKWHRVKTGEYTFKFVRDSFATAFHAMENFEQYGLKKNWIFKKQIPHGSLELRQLANTYASELAEKEIFDQEDEPHLKFSCKKILRAPEKPCEVSIFEAVAWLSSKDACKKAISPVNQIHSVAFGYAVTSLYVYGVALFEPYYLVVLRAINELRRQKDLSPLDLFEENESFAEGYTKARLKILGSSLKPMKSLRTSSIKKDFQVISIPIEIVTGETVSETIAKFLSDDATMVKFPHFQDLWNGEFTKIKIAAFKRLNQVHVYFLVL